MEPLFPIYVRIAIRAIREFNKHFTITIKNQMRMKKAKNTNGNNKMVKYFKKLGGMETMWLNH